MPTYRVAKIRHKGSTWSHHGRRWLVGYSAEKNRETPAQRQQEWFGSMADLMGAARKRGKRDV